MPVTMNSFRCSNGHSFEANAKLRTRCPECGVMTKRSFGAAPVEHKTEPAIPPVVVTHEKPPVEPLKPTEPRKRPVLVRQGRPRDMTPVPHKKKEPPLPPKKTLVGSKVSAGLVKSKTLRARGTVPTIKGRPTKTAVARGGVMSKEQKPVYWHEVARKYGIGS